MSAIDELREGTGDAAASRAEVALAERHVRRLRQAGTISLGLALAVLAGTLFTSYANWSSARRATLEAANEGEYLRAINGVLESLKDAETGQRGFVITGKEHYLEPYVNSLGRVESNLRRLTSLGRQQEERRALTERIAQQTRIKLGELAKTIRLRREGGFNAALAEVLTDRGKAAMDEVRQLCREASERQYAAAFQRSMQAESEQRQAVAIAGGGGVAMFLLLMAGAMALERSAKRGAQLTRQIEESRQLVEAMLKSIGDGVIATRTDGTLTFLNEQAALLTGWEQQEARGRKLDEVFQIVNESSRARVESPVEKVLRTGAVAGLANHTVLIRRDGSELPIDDSGAPIRDAEGRVAGVVMVFRGIAEQRRAEEALKKSHDQLLAANEELQQFAFAATHDLQEPLRTILIFSQLLARECRGKLEGKAETYLENIGEAAQRISDLVKDLLQYSQSTIETIPRAAVDPAEVLDKTLLQLQAAIGESGAHITHDGLPPVLANDAQLSQVFQNLLSNAIKYRRPEVNPEISISARSDGQDVLFQVSDNGLGFKQEYAERIFQIFRRLHGRDIPGTGIGLALCRRIIERHGGRIWAEGCEGQGSSFFFTLPVASKADLQ